jgi:hypothetical protein
MCLSFSLKRIVIRRFPFVLFISSQVNISLLFNPSHLEVVNPVVEGKFSSHRREHQRPCRITCTVLILVSRQNGRPPVLCQRLL